MLVLGNARLDLEKQELTIGARKVALPRKPYAVLLYLIENRLRMVGRKELLDRFWDGKEVYDQSLSKAVGAIRKALGEPTASEWIETRWGLGYRYIGPFNEESAPSPPSEQRVKDTAIVDLPHPPVGQEPASLRGEAGPELSPASLPFRVRLSWGAKSSATFVLVSVLCLLVLGLLAFPRHRPGSIAAPSTPFRSVAVLPFTAEGEDQYLGSELADAVAARLSTISQIRVRSSATVRSIVGFQVDPIADGKRLQVQSIVKGEIHSEQDKVVIAVQLCDSVTGAAVWSGAFNADKNNIFATEDSIAQQVSSAILPQFKMSIGNSSQGPDTSHPEAYSDYMKANFFATTRTRTSLAKAISLLTEAVRIDPNYARAYAAMANDYQLEGFYDFATPGDVYPRAEAAALKALSLDNTLVEAHIALLSTYTDYDWDFEGAEREFKAAVALDSNYAVAYQFYGYALMGMGRGDEGLATLKHAAQLDPVSPSVQTSLAWGHYLLRQYDQAVNQCKRVLELYPDFVPAHQLLGIVYGQMGSDQRSVAELTEAETLERDGAITPVLLDYELARTGERARAVRNLEEIQLRHDGSTVPDYYLAAAWAAAGNRAKALAFLERAFRSRSSWVIYLHYDARFDSLRHDQQFQALVHKVEFRRSLSGLQPTTAVFFVSHHRKWGAAGAYEITEEAVNPEEIAAASLYGLPNRPAERWLGGGGRDRTVDLGVMNPTL
jgi:TolB-like protein/DNA-binding winged helix-turn-helix (wHTH) protein/Tfp pilus assembly protein PilF